jgi:hypothetical protein
MGTIGVAFAGEGCGKDKNKETSTTTSLSAPPIASEIRLP